MTMDGVLMSEFYVCSLINPIRARFFKMLGSDQIPNILKNDSALEVDLFVYSL